MDDRNVLSLPGLVGMDFDIDSAMMEPIFDVMTFLNENERELADKFSADVHRFLQNGYAFHGIFRKAYDEAFRAFITSLIRDEIVEHFTSLNPEQIVLLTDISFIDFITDGYFFDVSNYQGVDNV